METNNVIKLISGLCLGLWLVCGPVGPARAASLQLAAPMHVSNGAIVRVADAPAEPPPEVFHLDPARLLFLGGGIVGGLLFISPTLEVGEFFGAALGLIGGEFLYQVGYKRAEKSNSRDLSGRGT